MRDELIRALADWESGTVETAELHALFPNDDVEPLLSMHGSLGAIAAAEPTFDADRVWSAIERRMSQPQPGFFRRIRVTLSRPLVAIAASTLLGGSVAYAADIGPVREGVHSVVKTVGRVLGIVSDDANGDREDRPAILPDKSEEPGEPAGNVDEGVEQGGDPGSESADDEPSGGDRSGENEGSGEQSESESPDDDGTEAGDGSGSDDEDDGGIEDGPGDDPESGDDDEPDVDEPAEPGVDDPDVDEPDGPEIDEPDVDEPDQPDEPDGDDGDEPDVSGHDEPDEPDDPQVTSIS